MQQHSCRRVSFSSHLPESALGEKDRFLFLFGQQTIHLAWADGHHQVSVLRSYEQPEEFRTLHVLGVPSGDQRESIGRSRNWIAFESSNTSLKFDYILLIISCLFLILSESMKTRGTEHSSLVPFKKRTHFRGKKTQIRFPRQAASLLVGCEPATQRSPVKFCTRRIKFPEKPLKEMGQNC